MTDGYYTTGTVTLANGAIAVTGIATTFLADDIRVGDKFTRNGYSIPIVAVNANSGVAALTLAFAWPGTTLTGTTYMIERLPDLTRALEATEGLLALLTNSGNLEAEGALTGAADKVSYYTGVGAKALTGFTPTGRGIVGAASKVAAIDAALSEATAVVAAASTNIGAADGDFVLISGNTTITTFAGGAAGVERTLYFSGTPTIVHSGTLVLPGSANIQIESGDLMTLRCHGAGNWRCVTFTRRSGRALRRLAPFHFTGLKLSNNVTDATNDIDIATGWCSSIADDADLVLTTGMTKRLDAAWAVGTNAGGLDTGVKTLSTWYHLFLIRRPDTGVVDVLFSTSPTSPAMPTNYTQKRRIGAVRTDASNAIMPFLQIGRDFSWYPPIADANALAMAASTGFLLPLTVPLGIKVRAKMAVFPRMAANYFAMRDPDLGGTIDVTWSTDYVPDSATGTDSGGSMREIWTNASSQVQCYNHTAVGATLLVYTRGWYDPMDAS